MTKELKEPLTHIVVETAAEHGMGEVAGVLRVTEKTRWTIDIGKYPVKPILRSEIREPLLLIHKINK